MEWFVIFLGMRLAALDSEFGVTVKYFQLRVATEGGEIGTDGIMRGKPLLLKIFRPSPDWRDYVFVACAAQWIVVNLVLFFPYVEFLYRVGTFQDPANSIFPITWTSALGLFVYGLWLFVYRYRQDYFRSTIYAFGLPLAATSLFEVIWQNIGAGLHIGNQTFVTDIINLSSILMALCSFRFWRSTQPLLYCAVIFLAGWVLWMSLGYPQIYSSQPQAAEIAFLVNAILKVLSFVIFALLVSFAPRPAQNAAMPSGGQPSGVVLKGWKSSLARR